MTVSVVPQQATAGTAQGITQAQREIDMADAILQLQPSETPFISLLRKLMKKKAISPKFEWLEDEWLPVKSTFNNTTEVAQAGTVVVATGHGPYFAAQDLVQAQTTKEVFKVTSVSTDTLTVTRNWDGGASTRYLTNGEVLLKIGSAFAEGALASTARHTKTAAVYNYTEIFRKAVKITGTLASSRLYGGPQRTYQRLKQAREFNWDMERAFWFGARVENLTGDTPQRSTGGVITQFITTNVTTLANEAAFTRSAWETFLESLFFYGSDTRWAFATPRMVSLIDQFAHNSMRIQQVETARDGSTRFGVHVSRYQSGHGEVNIINTRTLKDYGNGKILVCLDIDDEGAAYRFLEGRDTKLRLGIEPNDADYFLDEWIGETGLQLGQERRHGLLKLTA